MALLSFRRHYVRFSNTTIHTPGRQGKFTVTSVCPTIRISNTAHSQQRRNVNCTQFCPNAVFDFHTTDEEPVRSSAFTRSSIFTPPTKSTSVVPRLRGLRYRTAGEGPVRSSAFTRPWVTTPPAKGPFAVPRSRGLGLPHHRHLPFQTLTPSYSVNPPRCTTAPVSQRSNGNLVDPPYARQPRKDTFIPAKRPIFARQIMRKLITIR